MRSQRFSATLASNGRGGIYVPVPFDPDAEWGQKPRHHVSGTINGMRIRAIIESGGFTMGPGWLRDCGGLSIGDVVTVEVTPEGPQRADLAEDFAAALEAEPDAGAFFDGLAQFYRRGYLRWIDATKRSPERRAQRIAEVVGLLKAGVKERS